MIIQIISGGQTGADQGGLFGARDAGVPTGGFAPKGFLTETGPEPDLLKGFGLVESNYGYVGRTHLNAEAADITLWFGLPGTPGYFATQKAVKNKTFVGARYYSPQQLADIVKNASVVNIAGNRESKNPGIFVVTRETVREMLLILKGNEAK